MEQPSYDELLELLDDVSAMAVNVIIHYHPDTVEKMSRLLLANRATTICDEFLRGGEEQEEDRV